MTVLSAAILVILYSLHNVVPSSTEPLDDPDVGLNTVSIRQKAQSSLALLIKVQMIQSHGYPIESHTITTEDGYILTYHRIPYGTNGSGKRPPVLLLHGAACSSADYVNMGPERSLSYILADIGYDVWLGNVRGNAWCRNHTSLDVETQPEQFFNFSWHEMGYYDLPAAIDYILGVNGDDALHYVGHSFGTTVFLVLASTKPEYNSKIKLASLMAPIASMENQSNAMLQIVAQFIYEIEALAEQFKLYEIPFVDEIRNFAVDFCSQAAFYPICEEVIFQALGADEPQLDQEKIAVLLTNTPSNTPLKQFFHSGQLIKNGGFSQFDYGATTNLEVYGSETPPAYDLSQISAPVALYYGPNDAVVNIKDVAVLIKELPNVANDYLVPYDLFNHFDFLIAKDVMELLYVELIKVMQRY